MNFESFTTKHKTAPFSEVSNSFKSTHDLTTHGNQWGLFNIEAAQAQFGETWTKKCLSGDEILNIVLPFHQHPENEGLVLIPAEGLSVKDAITRFRSLGEYSQTNHRCWERIHYLKQDSNPFFLSILPISHGDYLKLDEF